MPDPRCAPARRLTLGLILLGLLAPRAAHADAPEARATIATARADFADGKDAEAIALLRRLIEDEGGGGYASCAHRELALHFAKQGHPARAQQEARKAVAAGITVALGADCVVVPLDPQLQPLLGGPPRPQALRNRTLPRTAGVRPINGRELLTTSGGSAWLVDRAKKTRVPLLLQSGATLARTAWSPDGNRIILEFESDPAFIELTRAPFRIRTTRLPIVEHGPGIKSSQPFDVIFLDGDDEAVLYDGNGRGNHQFTAYRARLGSDAPPKKLVTIKGLALVRQLHRVLYLRFSGTHNTQSPFGWARQADAVLEHQLLTGQRRVIHTFAKPDHPKNWAHAVVDWHSANQVGSDPATVAQTLLVSDGAVGTLLVLYDDPGAAQPVIRTLPAAFPVNPSVQLGRDGRTLLVGQDQKVTLYDPVTDTLRVVSFARRCTPPLPPAKVNLSDFGFGQWQDGTIWLRRDNELLLDDGHGGQRCVDLLRFTSDAHPDWSIGYYSFFNPDELWLGIEQGARGYLWIGWDELTKASRPLGH